jgi:DNA-binding NarL/FixJ family response regulator
MTDERVVRTRTVVSVVVADDDEAFLRALTSVLADEPGFEVTGAATTTSELLDVVATSRPDVVLADVRMPGGGIPAAAEEIRASCPSVVIVALTAHRFGPPLPSLERAGVIGPLAKGLALSDLLTVIARAVAERNSLR